MAINPIGAAVPFFLLLIGIEYVHLRRKGATYRINDAITDMSCGLGDQVIAIFVKSLVLIPYTALEKHAGYFEFATDSPMTWIFGFLAVDLAYYTYHRFSHRVNFGWAIHVVHHQSEAYNLSVALRQPWVSQAYGWVFYLPLALLGLPLEVYATAYAFNLLYQFWIHTETIDRLGPIEWFFNTPSHHRVHHGTNPEYIDKNYAGMLIIWDRMFGTFQLEGERPLYGTLKPLRSWNAVWANVSPWVQLFARSRLEERYVDKVRIWFMPPEWTVDGPMNPAELFDGVDRGYDVDQARDRHIYIICNMVVVGVCIGIMLAFETQISVAYQLMGSGFILMSFMVWTGLFEGRAWAWPLECLRLTYAVICALILYGI
jgi:alkylglycerol monooxygenase